MSEHVLDFSETGKKGAWTAKDWGRSEEIECECQTGSFTVCRGRSLELASGKSYGRSIWTQNPFDPNPTTAFIPFDPPALMGWSQWNGWRLVSRPILLIAENLKRVRRWGS